MLLTLAIKSVYCHQVQGQRRDLVQADAPISMRIAG